MRLSENAWGVAVIDWDDLRFFLSIARQGSLTAAARELAVAQSTVGRRLATLEASLGVRLLHRTPEGYVLTLAGESVRDQARRVETEALALVRRVEGRDSRLEGVVRVTCAETVAAHILAPCFAVLQDRHPDILVELIPDPRELSLAMRETDIAIRLTRPVQNDLVVRRIGCFAFGLYVGAGYVERHGLPDFESGCIGHRCMILIDDISGSAQTIWLEALTQNARLGLQTTSHQALLQATRDGAGLACLARFRADDDPDLVALPTPMPSPKTDIFLVVHKDNRGTPRVRAVLDAVAATMKSLEARLDPPDDRAV